LFRRGRCSLAGRGRIRKGPDFRYFGCFSFVYAGALIACAGIFSCSGVAAGRAGVWGFFACSCVHVDIRCRRTLLSPRVHVDVGGRGFLFRRRIVPRRGSSFVRRGRRCRRRGVRVTCRRYVGGNRGCWFGSLRAATGARSLIRSKRSPEKRENTKLVIKARDMSEERKQRKETYPEATGLGFFGLGAPTFCLFCDG
jgi:hypothetical protein